MSLSMLKLFDYALFKIVKNAYGKVEYGAQGGLINHYLNNVNTPELLFIGNSTTKRHIIPDSIFLSSFNLSHYGMGISFNHGLMSVLAQNNKLPQHIVLSINVDDMLVKNEEEKTHISDCRNLGHYYASDSLVTTCINKSSKFEKIKYWFLSYRYNGQVLNTIIESFRKRKYKIGFNGFEGLNVNPKDTLRLEENEIETDVKALEKEINKQSLQQIIAIKDLLDLHHSNLILLVPQEYLNKPLEYLSVLKEFEEFVDQNKIATIDFYSNRIKELNKKKYWYDNTHLNIEGAALYSAVLNRELSTNRGEFLSI